ncbi:MAG: ankyrin repeat domain-containing protein [Enterobacteriaceae bacterium]
MKKSLTAILFITFLLTGIGSVMAGEDDTQANYPRFTRLSTQQLVDLANPQKMSRRIFYQKLSVGSHAKWFDAVKTGNLAQVKKMAEGGQDIEVRDEASLGETALGWAAFIGYLDIVEYLVGKGANLYAPDGADVTHVLKAAVAGGQVEVIEFLYPLMKEKIDLNEQDLSDDETLLMMAVETERLGVVKWLLKQKVDVNIVAEFLATDALGIACRRNDKVMKQLLIDAGAIHYKTGKASCP